MSLERHVRGLSQLKAFLDALPVKLERNIMRSALRAGARVVLPVARANIRSRDGALAASLKAGSSSKGGQVRGYVRTRLFYARMVEYGTRAHYIKINASARPTRMTRRGVRAFSIGTINKMVNRGSLVIGGAFVGESVSHPGAARRPFLRPALDTQAGAALMAVGEQIKKRLTKEGLDVSGVELEGDDA